jgi:hypothetical protein
VKKFNNVIIPKAEVCRLKVWNGPCILVSMSLLKYDDRRNEDDERGLPAYEVTFTFTYFSILYLHRFTISRMIVTSFASATSTLQQGAFRVNQRFDTLRPQRARMKRMRKRHEIATSVVSIHITPTRT